jgi:hypothetical protein
LLRYLWRNSVGDKIIGLQRLFGFDRVRDCGDGCRRLLGDLDAVAGQGRLVEEQECGQAGGSGGYEGPEQRTVPCCRPDGRDGNGGAAGGVQTGEEFGKETFR